jgi:NhaP-type Na+/H+ or K+/H+ antiporter
LIGASINLSIFGDILMKGILLALIIIFVARPIAVLGLFPLKRWGFREYLFISPEGPRGVVPSALAGLPLTLGLMYKQQSLIDAGEIILAATMITILVSVIAETLWMKPLSKILLKHNKN